MFRDVQVFQKARLTFERMFLAPLKFIKQKIFQNGVHPQKPNKSLIISFFVSLYDIFVYGLI